MYILSPAQIKKADKATITNTKITSTELMEHAATLCFEWLHQRLQGQNIKIHVFCGIGNNGGDGLVMARHLHQHGYNVNCYVVNFSDKRTEDFLINYNRLKEIGEWPTVISHEEEFPTVNFEDIVIDAIFGNGLTRKPTEFTKKLIQYINSTKVFTLAIDMPSGMFAEKTVTNSKSVLKAGHILTFQAPKLAFFLPENKNFFNTWEVIDIGLDSNFINSLKPKTHLINKPEALQLYQPRERWAHKASLGHSLLIGGSFGKIGAIALASEAALKIGSGLVSAYIPKCGYTILQTKLPEVMVEVDEEKHLSHFNFKTKATVIGIGTGLGKNSNTAKGLEKFLTQNKLPLVIDADALNIISENKKLLTLIPKNSVLTPHPKELERLIGSWKNDFDKLEKAKKLSQKHNIILVLKDAITFIIKNDFIYINNSGNQALATGGSGDVLTGIITGLIAQNYDTLSATILGVYLHGKTAEIALNNLTYESFTASDIINYLPDAYIDLFTKEPTTLTEESESEEKK